jgi:hypothetical protein
LRGKFFNAGDKTSADDIKRIFKDVIENDRDEPFGQIRELLGHGTSSFDDNLEQFLKIREETDIVSPWSS